LVKYTGADHGSIGPINLKTKFKIIADNLLKGADNMVSGANRDGYHFKNIDFDRDCTVDEFYDLRTVNAGETCPNCSNALRVVKAIELGHIFKLGTKYSDALQALFLDKEGKEHPIIMGSYGIGVERVLACYIEQNYDENGIIWDKCLTPYQVHLVGINLAKSEEVSVACENIYADLEKKGWKILFDDRDLTAGVKFNDADLIGIPIQIIIGKKNLDNQLVEIKYRRSGERKLVKMEELGSLVEEFYK
jgi:prolyl-tRNA synthetase